MASGNASTALENLSLLICATRDLAAITRPASGHPQILNQMNTHLRCIDSFTSRLEGQARTDIVPTHEGGGYVDSMTEVDLVKAPGVAASDVNALPLGKAPVAVHYESYVFWHHWRFAKQGGVPQQGSHQLPEASCYRLDPEPHGKRFNAGETRCRAKATSLPVVESNPPLEILCTRTDRRCAHEPITLVRCEWRP